MLMFCRLKLGLQTSFISELKLYKMAKSSFSSLKFIDIGANLSDAVYSGRYHGKQAHPDDMEHVLQRAKDIGVEKMIITGGSLEDSIDALKIAKTDVSLYSTVGCHPTRSLNFEQDNQDPDAYLQELIALAKDNKDKVVCVGEMGLDFDRLHFSPKEAQMKYFEKQMELISATQLPVFFHCRNAFPEFLDIVSRHIDSIPGGVVHSFTGTKEEVKSVLDLGLYIGINGCSLKTQDNIDVMCSIPSDRLMIETDCPYCEVRPTHAGHKYITTKFETKKKEKFDSQFMVKSRNEPCTIIQVLEVMCGARNEDKYQLAEVMYKNTLDLFFKNH